MWLRTHLAVETKGDVVITAQCPECDYRFDEITGNPREGFPAGTLWAAVPDDWNCPDCGVRDKLDFVIRTENLTPCVRN